MASAPFCEFQLCRNAAIYPSGSVVIVTVIYIFLLDLFCCRWVKPCALLLCSFAWCRDLREVGEWTPFLVRPLLSDGSDFMSGRGPARTNGIGGRSPRQPGIRTAACMCVCVVRGVGGAERGKGGGFNVLKPDESGTFYVSPGQSSKRIISGTKQEWSSQRTEDLKEKVNWRGDGKRQGRGVGGFRGEVGFPV